MGRHRCTGQQAGGHRLALVQVRVRLETRLAAGVRLRLEARLAAPKKGVPRKWVLQCRAQPARV